MTSHITTSFIKIPANKSSIKRRKLSHKVGINNADYQVNPKINGKRTVCPFYKSWISMIERCYSKKHKITHQTYIGCTVVEDWLIFLNFKKWMECQDWKNKHLDKDIIFPGNKVYSPENCVFVSQEINKLLNNNKSSKGKYPQGVSLYKRNGKFIAQCSKNNKSKQLGFFVTPEGASKAYKKFKSSHIITIANQQQDDRIKNGLLKHAELIYTNSVN